MNKAIIRKLSQQSIKNTIQIGIIELIMIYSLKILIMFMM